MPGKAREAATVAADAARASPGHKSGAYDLSACRGSLDGGHREAWTAGEADEAKGMEDETGDETTRVGS